MPRNPQRKTEKGSFSVEKMREAIQLVCHKNYSIRQAATLSGLSFQTLARYVKSYKSDPACRLCPNYSVNKVFSDDEETVLADYLKTCSKMFYGLRKSDVRSLAYEMAVRNNKKFPKQWAINKLAGKEWLHSFLLRNTSIVLRTAESCSLARSSSFNKYNVQQFFNNVKDVMSRHCNFGNGTRIFNLDETSTTTVQGRHEKIIAEKGTKKVCKTTSGEKGITVTTCLIVCAAGYALPPVLIFPRVNYKDHMLTGAPPGSLGLATLSGWMNADLFVSTMNHFIKVSGSTIDNPSLIIYDNHESHLSLEVVELAKQNGVTILTIPPHCSDKLQPLDVGVMKPFQTFYNQAVETWVLSNPGKAFNIYNVAGSVGKAFERSMTPTNIKNAFKKTGIFPVDQCVFSEEDLLPSFVTERPILNNTQTPFCTPSSSKQFISPEMIVGYPKKVDNDKPQQKRKRGKTMIATDTPEKGQLKLKCSRANMKKIKKLKFQLGNDKCDDEDDGVLKLQNDYDEEEEEEEETFSDLEEPDPKFLSMDLPQVEVGDFVLTEFVTVEGKVSKKFYIGEILEEMIEEQYRVKFLRKSQKIFNAYVYPLIDDIAVIRKNQIRMILPKPMKCGQTKRLQASLKFEIHFPSSIIIH